MTLEEFVTYITDKLNELKTEKAILHYDLWNKQIFYEAIEKPFRFPAIFLELDAVSADVSIGQTALEDELFNQQIEVQFSLWLVFTTLENENTTFFKQIIPLRTKVLGKFNNQNIGDGIIVRTGELQDTDHDRVLFWKISFKISFTETITNEDYTSATVEIAPEIDMPIIEPNIRSNTLT